LHATTFLLLLLPARLLSLAVIAIAVAVAAAHPVCILSGIYLVPLVYLFKTPGLARAWPDLSYQKHSHSLKAIRLYRVCVYLVFRLFVQCWLLDDRQENGRKRRTSRRRRDSPFSCCFFLFFLNVCTHDYADPQRERERDAVCANCQDTQKLFYSLKKEKREESQVLLGHNKLQKPVVEANFLPTK
jgi:hypothetical protein